MTCNGVEVRHVSITWRALQLCRKTQGRFDAHTQRLSTMMLGFSGDSQRHQVAGLWRAKTQSEIFHTDTVCTLLARLQMRHIHGFAWIRLLTASKLLQDPE